VSIAETIREFAESGSAPHADARTGRARNPLLVSGSLLTLAIACGLAVGGAQSWSVSHLPFSLEALGNTAAPWFVVAFAVAMAARRIGGSMTVAMVCLLSTVAGFYAVEAMIGWGVSSHQVVQWSVCSVVAGPLVGLAAGSFRHAGRLPTALGAGLLGGLLVGEAVWGLTGLKLSSPADYWHVQIAVGVALTIGLTLWRSRDDLRGGVPMVAASLAAGTMVGLATLAAFRVGS
jgi:hypothetical protein